MKNILYIGALITFLGCKKDAQYVHAQVEKTVKTFLLAEIKDGKTLEKHEILNIDTITPKSNLQLQILEIDNKISRTVIEAKYNMELAEISKNKASLYSMMSPELTKLEVKTGRDYLEKLQNGIKEVDRMKERIDSLEKMKIGMDSTIFLSYRVIVEVEKSTPKMTLEKELHYFMLNKNFKIEDTDILKY